MTKSRVTNLDLMVHGLIFLRIAILCALFVLAYICWVEGGLFLTPSLIIYFLYCMLWNTWGFSGIGHELVHNSPFRSDIANKTYLWLVSLLTLSNKNLFFITHFAHHKVPHSSDDFESPSTFNSEKQNHFLIITLNSLFDLRKFINFIRYMTLNVFRYIPIPKMVDFLKRKKRFDDVIWNARVILGYLIAVIGISIIFNTTILMIFLIIPNFIGTGLAKSLVLLQHPTANYLRGLGITQIEFGGKSQSLGEFDDNFIRDKLDIKIPLFISFFYANMNYHASHHYCSTVPFFHLPSESDSNVRNGLVGRIEISKYQIYQLCFALNRRVGKKINIKHTR